MDATDDASINDRTVGNVAFVTKRGQEILFTK